MILKDGKDRNDLKGTFGTFISRTVWHLRKYQQKRTAIRLLWSSIDQSAIYLVSNIQTKK